MAFLEMEEATSINNHQVLLLLHHKTDCASSERARQFCISSITQGEDIKKATYLAATGGDGAELLRDACRPFAARA